MNAPATSLRTLLDRCTAASATGDLRAIAAIHAPNGELRLHVDERQVRGRAAIAGWFSALFERWPCLASKRAAHYPALRSGPAGEAGT